MAPPVRRNLLGLIAALIALSAVAHFAPRLGDWAGFALLAVAAGIGLAAGAGPVFVHEFRRVGRSTAARVGRIAAAFGLMVIVGVVFEHVGAGFFDGPDAVTVREASRASQSAFLGFLGVGWLLILGVAPALFAAEISGEKERGTLEFLFATDLSAREIVFGKWLARLAWLLTLILATLPVLAAMQFYGGVEYETLLLALAAMGLASMSLSAVGIAASVECRRSRTAVVGTALVIGLFTLAAWLVDEASRSDQLTDGQVTFWREATLRVWVVNPLNVLDEVLNPTLRVSRHHPSELLTEYATSHLALTAFALLWACLRLRPVGLRQVQPGRAADEEVSSGRPDVGPYPIFWRALFVEAGRLPPLPLRMAGWLFALLALGVAFLWTWGVFLEDSAFTGTSWKEYREGMNLWTRFCLLPSTAVLYLTIAINGATSIRSEYDRQTIDPILCSPLTSSAIVWGKYWAAVLSPWRIWRWLGLVWLIGAATGAVHPLALIASIGTTVGFALGHGWVGVWFSAGARGTTRAIIGALAATAYLNGGFLLVCSALSIPLNGLGYAFGIEAGSASRETPIDLMISPVASAALIPVRDLSAHDPLAEADPQYLLMALPALAGWGLMSIVLWAWAMRRFRRKNFRGVMRSERTVGIGT